MIASAESESEDDRIYARSRYDQDIDYAKRLSPPLPAEDIEWLRGVRT